MRSRRRRRLSIRRLWSISTVLLLSTVLIAVSIGVVAIARTVDALSADSMRDEELRNDVDARRLALLNQEVGLRGFLASADESLLQPYEAGERDAARLRAQLPRVLDADERRTLGGAVDAEIAAAQRWRHEVAEPEIAERRASDVLDLPAMMRIGKRRFDEYRDAHTRLRGAVDRTAGVHARRRERQLFVLDGIIAAIVIGFVVVAVAISRWLVRRAIRPVVALSDAAQRGEVSVDAVRDSNMHEVIVLAETIEQLFRATQDRAMRDGLTRAYNRGFLAEWLPRQLRLTRRNKSQLTALMVDVDHFKRINDSFGHAAGDEVLMAMARCIEQQLRHSDVVVRYGGEEFTVFLPDTAVAGGFVTGERLRAAIAAMTEREGLPAGLRITASIGVATVGPDDDGGQLLPRADAALYQAKRGGRNRVVSAGPEQPDDRAAAAIAATMAV